MAAADSDIELGHNDHYAYVWPRDGAFVADAMDRAGFHQIPRRFLQFAHDTISNDGYFLHKYAPDGSVASSWNPWVRNGKKQLPIQEDSTALVVWLLARHYDRTRDLEFIRSVYRRLVVQPADFMAQFRDPETHLPLPSFDMWEERQGVFTFTSSAVCAALQAAADLANLFNEQERRAHYLQVAGEIREAMVRHLWLEDEGRFARGLTLTDDSLVLDRTVDASTFATFFLGVFAPDTAMVEGTMRAIRETLWVQTEIGGVARYAKDPYQRNVAEDDPTPGNPWLICTLWLAEHAIAGGARHRPGQIRCRVAIGTGPSSLGAGQGAAVARAAGAGASIHRRAAVCFALFLEPCAGRFRRPWISRQAPFSASKRRRKRVARAGEKCRRKLR